MKYLLGDICSFAKGASTPRARMYTEGDYLYLHYGDLYKGHELYIDVNDPQKELPFILNTEKLRDSQFCQDEDIVYVLTSETVDDLGKALLLNNPSSCPVVAGTETTIMRIERRDVALPRYINYLLQTTALKKMLQQYVTGMKVFRVHPRDIARIEVDLPSLSTQAKAVAILDAISEKIRNNTKTNDYLEQLLDTLWANACLDYEKRLLPEVVHILPGGTPRTSVSEYWEDGTIPFFSPKDVGCPYTLETEKYVTELGVDNCNSALYPVDTVFLTARGTVGKVGLAGVSMAMNQSCFAFSGIEVEQSAVYQIIKSAVMSLKAKANGATFAAINTRDLKDETIVLPSKERLDNYQSMAQSIHSSMLTNTKESERLKELRDALLPKLMSGEIDVSQIDITQLNNHLRTHAFDQSGVHTSQERQSPRILFFISTRSRRPRNERTSNCGNHHHDGIYA